MKKIIYLIEDDEMIVDVYSTGLKKNKDFEIKSFMEGKKFLDLKEGILENEEFPDIILLDLILPDIEGVEILKEIRKEEKFNNVPIFIISNYISGELKKKTNDLNVELYINKINLLPSELFRLVSERLKTQ